MADILLQTRALILRDLASCLNVTARMVDVVEDALSQRYLWIQEWPQASRYVPGQVAQDVQEQLLNDDIDWPICPRHFHPAQQHPLHIEPDLGAEAIWTCAADDMRMAPLGQLVAALHSVPRRY